MTTDSLSAAHPRVDASDVLDKMTESQASATEIGAAEFMSRLDSSHTQGLDELNFSVSDSYAAEDEEAEEEVTEVAATKENGKKPKKRSTNYSEEEDVALCHAWMNISHDASVGTNQCKEKFWQRIEEHYRSVVKIPSYRTQGSLSHRWDAILECCNRWTGTIETVNNSPPSGVLITQYMSLQQEVYKHRNKKGGHKAFTLFHYYKELEGNKKWLRRNYETTPKWQSS
nr:glutathione S-transferase T3-like [Lolium perenne]